MKPIRWQICCFSILCTLSLPVRAQETSVLILTAGRSDYDDPAYGDGRQLKALLGHFSARVTLKGALEYVRGEADAHDVVFYIGFDVHDVMPASLANDLLKTRSRVVWMNTGIVDFCRRSDVAAHLSFTVSEYDSTSGFDKVRAAGTTFKKEDAHLARIRILDRNRVEVLATAVSSRSHREAPYAIRSGNFFYFADSPFAYAVPGGHYLFFADLLHDILGQPHETVHQAMIRIEDVTLFESPDKLRSVADFLSSRGVPFMVGVVPFFVDPAEGLRLSLTDKPELVDALQYMVRNGGTIVMHGVTHQYKGVTATDYEFWDEGTRRPIKGESEEAIARKLEMGIQEFLKNGLYPLVWETPHYTASSTLYRTVAKYFSTACEQRLALDHEDQSQFFPYVIHRDLYGQTVYPENLGYVPQDSDLRVSEAAVDEILESAAIQRSVRDGIATAFIHAFLDRSLLERLVDGLQRLGYTFLDMREQTHWVRMRDRAILCGSQTVTVTFNDQYVVETVFDRDAEIRQRSFSDSRETGEVSRTVQLGPGEFYKIEPAEFKYREPGVLENLVTTVERFYERVTTTDQQWAPARVKILWNHYALGAAYNDQASLASVFQSVQIPVDTLFLGDSVDIGNANLLIVPYSIADSLTDSEIANIDRFVYAGGNLIIDGRTELAPWFGINFVPTRVQVRSVRDRVFPEERIVWRYPELVQKFDALEIDRIFAVDEVTETPLVVGLRIGNGKVLFINGRFDPRSQLGTSHYPFMLEYVRRYFRLQPIVRAEQLEMYFDPGFRHTHSVENLVRAWVNHGIRIIHVAGWHEYPKYTYDYGRLIRLAHANGILVYAWLEPPQVSLKFWQDHPQWREKNHLGDDVRPSWRYPMALTDSACVRAMTEKFVTFLRDYDWDGVNLAELYFEAGRGFEDAGNFSPVHPSAIAELRSRYGIDLRAMFDSTSRWYWKTNAAAREQVVRYRVEKLEEVYERMLGEFREIVRTKPGFDIVVTAMDELGSPELREHIGVDMPSILRLQREHGFVLQVEDPQSRWSTTPLRYEAIGAQYSPLVSSPDRLMLDLNILTFRTPEYVTPFPTLVQTGTESFHLVRSASMGAQRVSTYSESSVNPQDMAFLASASAVSVKTQWTPEGMHARAGTSFILRLPSDVSEITVNGMPIMPHRDNRYFIPAGEHAITFRRTMDNMLSAHVLQPRLMSTTGTVTALSYGTRSIAMTYESAVRMLVTISAIPARVTVDGIDAPFAVRKGNECFSLFLPTGAHTAVIEVGGDFEYGVTVTSFWSSTVIALFGLGAVTTLAGMFVVLKILKRRGSFTHV